ncbi:MAG: hypothetical protein PHO86_00110 [Bacilli bacterium]|nr:hypothetical protein [Bacilli bacterium]
MRKILKNILIVILFLIVVLLMIGKSSFDFTSWKYDGNEYNDVIKMGVGTSNPRVVDIAMLGAHDAFTSGIDEKSEVDIAEDAGSILRNRVAGLLANGLFSRLAKAQEVEASTMLVQGVRYFDIRLSFIDGNWYTKHGVISGLFSDSLDELIRFLYENTGEIAILDFQHVYLGENTYDNLLKYLELHEVKPIFNLPGITLTSFINYNPQEISLGELKYNDVTTNGTRAGVVILMKTEQAGEYNYVYQDSIRSTWHEDNSTEIMLTKINAEVVLINSNNLDKDKFRVNQAQKTGLYSLNKVATTLVGWSLLDMAANFNPLILEQNNLDDWFKAMPILMVDNATSQKKDFNKRINEYIIVYNQENLH